jgi:hypothetical protein
MTQITTDRQATGTYLDEWIVENAVDPELARLNCKRMTASAKIAALLNWKNYDLGSMWYVESVDLVTGKLAGYGQGKPKTALVNEEGKVNKYVTYPKGQALEAIFLRVTDDVWGKIADRYNINLEDLFVDDSRDDGGFWQWILDHPEIAIVFTEGLKKAACLLDQGYAAVCLPGVWGWKIKDKKELTPAVATLARGKRRVKLVFDADIIEKEGVYHALRTFGKVLTEAGAIVSVVTWDLALGKGCDDFIVAHGSAAWEVVMSEEWTFDTYLDHLEKIWDNPAATKPKQVKQVTTDGEKKEKKVKLPKDARTFDHIEAEYKDRLRWYCQLNGINPKIGTMIPE